MPTSLRRRHLASAIFVARSGELPRLFLCGDIYISNAGLGVVDFVFSFEHLIASFMPAVLEFAEMVVLHGGMDQEALSR